MARPSGRANDQLRELSFTRGFTRHAEGSVLACFGDTRVLCNASVSRGVPKFMKGEGRGWITAEYGMLPRSTHDRMGREAARGKQGGRTLEIQRLIGRSLRCAVDLEAMGEYQITVDCDVLQADGGTRTASITGACVAMADALGYMQAQGWIESSPLSYMVAAISVGICDGAAVLDLDYDEDSNAGTDLNVVMTETGEFVEVQGTAEDGPFSSAQLGDMLDLARSGIEQLVVEQKRVLAEGQPGSR